MTFLVQINAIGFALCFGAFLASAFRGDPQWLLLFFAGLCAACVWHFMFMRRD